MRKPIMTMRGQSAARRPGRLLRRHAAIIPFRIHEEPVP
jgi:hypothetical protein